jgi:cytochrome c peroxidase
VVNSLSERGRAGAVPPPSSANGSPGNQRSAPVPRREFHNTGLFPPDALPTDRGRVEGAREVLSDDFNCLGPFAAANPQACAELRFVKTHGVERVGAFRTATLRNVAETGPYMHDGALATRAEVLDHYNRATPTLVENELNSPGLQPDELRQLEAFPHALDGPLATPPELLAPPASDARQVACRIVLRNTW